MSDSLAVMCFSAGPWRFAMAASEVAAIAQGRKDDTPLLASVLGCGDDGAEPVYTMRLVRGEASLGVSGPLAFETLSQASLVSADIEAWSDSRAVVGFARVTSRVDRGGALVTLLSGSRLLELLQQETTIG